MLGDMTTTSAAKLASYERRYQELAEMRAVAAQAAPLILAQEQSTADETHPRNGKRRSPETARRPSRLQN
jgi:hypothetical protein